MPSPVNLVIFLYWVGPVPYLELFWVGPVKKTTLYLYKVLIFPPREGIQKKSVISIPQSNEIKIKCSPDYESAFPADLLYDIDHHDQPDESDELKQVMI